MLRIWEWALLLLLSFCVLPENILYSALSSLRSASHSGHGGLAQNIYNLHRFFSDSYLASYHFKNQ